MNGHGDLPSAVTFTLEASQSSDAASGARLGTLSKHGRTPMQTPNFVGVLSRGIIPHLTPDMLADEIKPAGVYAALEDFVEKTAQPVPPLLQQPTSDRRSRLRDFVALPDDVFLVLGARRAAPVVCPIANSNVSVTLSTSVGFQQISMHEYAQAAFQSQPDIVVALGDIPYGAPPGHRRRDKMAGRTETWVKELMASLTRESDLDESHSSVAIFAPILPVEAAQQLWYLDLLTDDLSSQLAGLAIYDTTIMPDLPEQLQHLPRLCLGEPSSPHALLVDIELGADICSIPFVTAATDSGIALDFTFPPTRPAGSEINALGIDMWSSEHATDLGALSEGCQCYACRKHHRAYIQHLLIAKEMLAWVLIQVHNLHTIEHFFRGVRASIQKGDFEQQVEAFGRVYEQELPQKTGQGPRIRGYQFRSEGPGEARRNAPAFRMLDDQTAKTLEAPTLEADTSAQALEKLGLATTNGSHEES